MHDKGGHEAGAKALLFVSFVVLLAGYQKEVGNPEMYGETTSSQ